MDTETLNCVPGNHTFTRTRTRGIKPTICPACKDDRDAAKEVISTTVTLTCQIGNHTWERPSQRGKRPANCPSCVETVLSTPQEGPETDENTETVDRLTPEVETFVKVSGSELAERLFIKMAALANKERQVIVHSTDMVANVRR